jgi:hypothetical protein
MLRSSSFLAGSSLLVALSTVACGGDSLTTPGTATLEITTSTSGAEPDPDGYTVQVDAGATQTIGPSASIQSTDLSPGDHAVQLAGIAPNCGVAGDNPRTVSVAAGQTATVAFAVTCAATTGGLQVTATTTGPSPDVDGYSVTVDGTEHGTLGTSGAVNVDGLAPGDHVVGISGVAANCQVHGDNPRTVTITPGAAASAAFTVTCAAPPPSAGTLRVQTATNGADLDPDGYTLAVDGGKAQPIGVNGTAVLANIAVGSHGVQLSGLASNCTIQGANPLSVNVPAGGMTDASFAITCGATSGAIKVSVTTTGSPTDPDGYVAKLDGGEPGQPIATDGNVSFTSVPVGSHTVALSGVAANCSVTDGASRDVTVTVGITSNLSFTVTCSSSGEIRWTTIPLPSDFAASAIWASSPSDIFVVAGSRSAPSTAGSSVLHYDGHTWTEQFHGGNWYTSPNALWGSSPADVFAAGNTNIWHYDGTQWQVTPRELELYSAIWGSSPHDVVAVGVSDASRESGLILHYDGRTWEHEGGGRGWYPGSAYDVAGSSPSDVYVVGIEWAPPDAPPEFDYSTSRVVHYDGNTWSTSFESKLISGTDAFSAAAVWANAPNDAFLVGSGGGILHFDGTAWSPMISPTSQALYDVWGNSSSNVYAVGAGGILHYDGKTWTVIKNTDTGRVWGVGTHVFVISRGEVMHGSP